MKDPIGPVAATFEERFLTVQDGVELRVLQWRPERPATEDPLVAVAGWISVIEGWAPVLRAAAPERPVAYIETREKRSARIEPQRLRVEHFTIERLAEDLIVACPQLGLDLGRAVLFGSSMGANAALEALKYGRLRPRAAFLVGPNAEFGFPRWGRPLVHIPAATYHVVRPFIIWYLRTFRVNAREEPEQMRRYERTLREADPVRLKLSARAVLDYRVWSGLETIEVPVAIAYARSDTLHGEGAARRIVDAIPRGETVCCPSNTYMHTADVTHDIGRFVASL